MFYLISSVIVVKIQLFSILHRDYFLVLCCRLSLTQRPVLLLATVHAVQPLDFINGGSNENK